MRIIFMGTAEFAAPALAKLAESVVADVVEVWTQPPRRSGRGMKLVPTPVQQLSQRLGIPCFCPLSFKDPAAQRDVLERVTRLQVDAAVVVAYGLLLPVSVLSAFRMGCWNLHGSLLPRWRGAAPVQRAIEAGDTEVGCCVIRMTESLDAGPVAYRTSRNIDDASVAETVLEQLAHDGASALVKVLGDLNDGTLHLTDQEATAATYASKLNRCEAQVDVREAAHRILRKIHAFWPAPVAWLHLVSTRGHDPLRVRVRQARLTATPLPDNSIGDLVEVAGSPLVVRCGDVGLALVSLQRSGGKWMNAREFRSGLGDLASWRVEVPPLLPPQRSN